MKNVGEGGVMVNQTLDEGFLSRGAHRERGISPTARCEHTLGQEQRVCKPLPRVTSHLSCATLKR
jgi:hypothetical protein